MHVLILVATVTLCERDDITREQTNQYVLPVVISQPGSTPSVWCIPPGLVARLLSYPSLGAPLVCGAYHQDGLLGFHMTAYH